MTATFLRIFAAQESRDHRPAAGNGRSVRSSRDDSEQGAAGGCALPERLAAADVLWTRLRGERPDHDVGPGAAGAVGDDAGSGRDQGATAAELRDGARRGRSLCRSTYD